MQRHHYPAGGLGCKPPASRIFHLSRRVHSAGPRALGEIMREILDGADPVERLERYARLDHYGDFIRANGGDRLPALRVVGRRR